MRNRRALLALAISTLSCGDNVHQDIGTLVVSPQLALYTDETGETATFTVGLTAPSSEDVVVTLDSHDTTEGIVSPATLTFRAGDTTAQTVTITGVDDRLADGDRLFHVIVDGGELGTADLTVTNGDDDVVGVVVSPIIGLTTSESGGTAIFTVSLSSEPGRSVTVPVASSDPTEGITSVTELTFTPVRYGPVAVVVTGVPDVLADGDVAYSIVLGPATSVDQTYNGFDADDVQVTNTDNGAGFVFSATTAEVSEFGDAETIDVALTRQPTADVTITFTSTDTTEGTVAPMTLTFTSVNWATPQTITITGADDNLDDGPIAFSITTNAATSTDPAYSGLDPTDISVTNFDNDTAAVYVKARSSLFVTEGGSTTTFRVRLTVAPTATVTCSVLSSDTTEGTVSPSSLVFQPNSFGYQTVTITGVDDTATDGDTTFTIVLGSCTSTDLAYSGWNPRDVSVVNRDDE